MNNIILSWDENMVDSFNANPNFTFKKLKIFDPEVGRFWGEIELQKVGTMSKERKMGKGKNPPKRAKLLPSCETLSEFCSIASSISDQVPPILTKPVDSVNQNELKDYEIKMEPTGVDTTQKLVTSGETLDTKNIGQQDLPKPACYSKTPYERPQYKTAPSAESFQGFELNVYGQFECPYCDRSYNSPATVKGHITRCHVGKYSKYTCTVCRAVKRDLAELQLHLIKNHSIDIRTAAVMSEMCETKSVM